ncbi:GatB/YqeY domain-containing protein, partial [Candidatus Bathyarchaeota archaeon]|nr:GatB/YqeY domain-containing protein [Candidatus Bathyarchaeota archaeon]
GAARMYPETDVPPVVVDQGKLQRIRDELPTQPDVKLKQLMNDYNINEKLASQILSSEYVELFERTATETTIAPSFVAATLVETIKGLNRQDIDISNLSEKTLFEVFKLVNSGRAAKEAIPDILSWLTKNSSRLPDEAVKALGFETASQEELEAVVSKAVKENKRLIDKRGDGALGPLMGTLMRELRGKVDAKTLSEILRKKIETVSRNNEST